MEFLDDQGAYISTDPELANRSPARAPVISIHGTVCTLMKPVLTLFTRKQTRSQNIADTLHALILMMSAGLWPQPVEVRQCHRPRYCKTHVIKLISSVMSFKSQIYIRTGARTR
jgi:hypothetical protein